MKEKYISIITNFGCHYTCPYCIVKENNLKIPKTTVSGLDKLEQSILEIGANIISISGGGDPLFKVEQHYDWYDRLFNIANKLNLPVEMHTSIIGNNQKYWHPEEYQRIVYHASTFTQLYSIHRIGKEKVRVVFVVTEDYTPQLIRKIANFVKESTEIDELSFRQMVDNNYKTTYYCYDYLLSGHKKDWWYITQGDYNIYYVENKISDKYQDFEK